MPCQCCVGACCTESGCSLTTQAECTGTWQGYGTTCDPDPCVCPCESCDISILVNGVAIALTTGGACDEVGCDSFLDMTTVCEGTAPIPDPDPCGEFGPVTESQCSLLARACLTACSDAGFQVRVYYLEFFSYVCTAPGSAFAGGGRKWYVDYDVPALPACGGEIGLSGGSEVEFVSEDCPDYYGVRCTGCAATVSLTCNPFP